MKTEVKVLKLIEIKPYWRNPRNNAKAIEVVKRSIELYGYNQYIVVDKKNTIIAGHTRYKALLELGYTEAEVIIAGEMTDSKAKEYRIADNKTNEFASWTEDLKIELREIEDLGIMQEFFQENLKEMIEKTVWAKDINVIDLEGARNNFMKNLKMTPARIKLVKRRLGYLLEIEKFSKRSIYQRIFYAVISSFIINGWVFIFFFAKI